MRLMPSSKLRRPDPGRCDLGCLGLRPELLWPGQLRWLLLVGPVILQLGQGVGRLPPKALDRDRQLASLQLSGTSGKLPVKFPVMRLALSLHRCKLTAQR